MEVLASNTHVFNSGAEFITHFLNFPARANVLARQMLAATRVLSADGFPSLLVRQHVNVIYVNII